MTSEGSSETTSNGALTTINLGRAEHASRHAIVSGVLAGCNPSRVVATASTVYVTARKSDALLAFSAKTLITHPAKALRQELSVGEGPVGLALVNHGGGLVIADSIRLNARRNASGLAVVAVGHDGRMTLIRLREWARTPLTWRFRPCCRPRIRGEGTDREQRWCSSRRGQRR